MSDGLAGPLTWCDRECAWANRCSGVGGTRCADCGAWYCTLDMDENGLCADCAEERKKHTCQECGRYDPDAEVGEDRLCETCRKEHAK